MKVGSIRKIVAGLESEYGVPRQRGKREKPLEVLIATILSQNTNDRNSHKAYHELRRKFPGWKNIAAASTRSIASAIAIGGLKNQKSRRIKALLKEIEKHSGGFSMDFLSTMNDRNAFDWLISQKGIGAKTAACVLLFSLRRNYFPVDTHIHRVLNRLGSVGTKKPNDTYEAMIGKVPKGKAYSFHINLIHFGRTVCESRKPRCGHCFLFDHCLFPGKEEFASIKDLRPKATNARFIILEHL